MVSTTNQLTRIEQITATYENVFRKLSDKEKIASQRTVQAIHNTWGVDDKELFEGKTDPKDVLFCGCTPEQHRLMGFPHKQSTIEALIRHMKAMERELLDKAYAKAALKVPREGTVRGADE